MTELLTINNIVFPPSEGGYTIDYTNKTVDYESESGKLTVEVIRENIIEITVSYNGLTEVDLKKYKTTLKLVNDIKCYDASTGTIKEFKAKASEVSVKKVWYKNDLSVWSLSFKLKEM